MNKLFLIFGWAAFALIALSCKNEGTNAGQDPANPAAVTTPATPVDPVAWGDLQALIPSKAAGMDKTNREDDKSSLGNVGFSHSLGIYEKGDRRLEIQIIDSGNQKFILSTLAPWRNMTSLDLQEDYGYEKYVTIDNNPGHEAFNNEQKAAKLSALINGRFIVILSGANLAMEELYKEMKNLDLDKIASM